MSGVVSDEEEFYEADEEEVAVTQKEAEVDPDIAKSPEMQDYKTPEPQEEEETVETVSSSAANEAEEPKPVEESNANEEESEKVTEEPEDTEESMPMEQKEEGDKVSEERQTIESTMDDHELYAELWKKAVQSDDKELERLKTKQQKRRVAQAEFEKQQTQRKLEEEQHRLQEIEVKKNKEAEEKRLRLEEAAKKREQMREQSKQKGTRNFTIAKRSGDQAGGEDTIETFSKTREQIAAEKEIAMQFRIKPLEIIGLKVPQLKKVAGELWEQIILLETENYDLEEKMKRQEYDMKEMKERQRQQLRQKALKLGLEPEALTGKYPPKVRVMSKFERRVGLRSYEENKNLFEGGFELIDMDNKEKAWRDRYLKIEQQERRMKNKWFGGRDDEEEEENQEEEIPPTENKVTVEIESEVTQSEILEPEILEEEGAFEGDEEEGDIEEVEVEG